ncbi:MAG: hypothetical protein ACREX8_00530 [Gammaproteobacteria bacterium]
MARFTRWLRRNIDAVLALLISVVVGILALADVLGTEEDQINAAILIVLALLAATLLRDRRSAAQALESASAVRLLSGLEVSQAHAEARHATELWIFKGGTGTYLRAVTLTECIEIARREKRLLRVQLEVIDPTDEALCKAYAQFRSSLAPGPDGTGEEWTLVRTRKESFATILAACWHRQRCASFLTIDVGLSRTMTTFRWDVSSRYVIMTQEDPAAQALMFEKGRPYYDAYNRELVSSFRQAKRVHLDNVGELQLSDEPTIEETRRLFTQLELELPASFSERDITDIVRKALRAKNPYP